MDYALTIIGFIAIFVGILGSFLPILPGPPIALLGPILLHFTNWVNYTNNQFFWMVFIVAGVTALDYIIPIYGAKWMGGSKAGTRGATIGLIVGLFLGPLGIIFGPFVGALIGELMIGRPSNESFKSALGAFVGFLAGTFAKIGVCVWLGIMMVLALF